jgi:hypothetical protein
MPAKKSGRRRLELKCRFAWFTVSIVAYRGVVDFAQDPIEALPAFDQH